MVGWGGNDGPLCVARLTQAPSITGQHATEAL